MPTPVILDTGVLIAFLMPKDKYHHWAVSQLSQITDPVITCEPVITEACFLAQRIHQGQRTILKLIKQGHIQITFNLNLEIATIENLMACYRSVPMSLADACLVRMSEIYKNSSVLTLDSDFQIYRRYKKQTIPIIIP